jgi:hypothetical protein
MEDQTTTVAVTNERNPHLDRTGKRGREIGSTNLHSKYPSSIAKRLKLAGVDWIDSFAIAVKRNDKALLSIWLRLLPFLIVTQGHKRVKKFKGRASKAALQALDNLERS